MFRSLIGLIGRVPRDNGAGAPCPEAADDGLTGAKRLKARAARNRHFGLWSPLLLAHLSRFSATFS
jgi:hypothetical protein